MNVGVRAAADVRLRTIWAGGSAVPVAVVVQQLPQLHVFRYPDGDQSIPLTLQLFNEPLIVFVELGKNNQVKHLAVTIGGLGGQTSAGDLPGNERGDLCGGDLLEELGRDHRGLSPSVLGRFRGPLLCFDGDLAAGDLDRVAHGSERIPQIVDVGLSALGGLDGANVLHVGGQRIADGRCVSEGMIPRRRGRGRLRTGGAFPWRSGRYCCRWGSYRCAR